MTVFRTGLTLSADQAVAVLSVAGELDLSCANTLKAELLDLRPPIQTVVVDMAEVSFLDSTALGALVGARRVLESAGMRLLVVNVVPAVWRIFRITGLVETLRVHQAPEPPAVLDPFALAAAG